MIIYDYFHDYRKSFNINANKKICLACIDALYT